jgi:hypothetical protein
VVVVVLVVLSVVSLAQSQAVLRAINGASKTLEWSSSSNGDLSFSHNGKNYLTFLTSNNNNADFPQGGVCPAHRHCVVDHHYYYYHYHHQ